jgi:imidazolonepropionase-like amidohydrolase
MSDRLFNLITSFIIFLLLDNIVHAQSDPSGQKRITSTYLITNITLISKPGNLIPNQDILFKDGQIISMGTNLKRVAEAHIIPGDSLFAYPGFIDMASKSGVIPPSIPDKPVDFDSSNPPDVQAGIHPHFDVLEHYNAEDKQVEVWRKNGFTIAHKVPIGQGMLPGTTGLVVYGVPKSNTVVRKDVARYAKFSTVGGMYPATNLGVMAKFRDLYENARLLNKHQVVFASNAGIKLPEHNPVLEALLPVIEKKKPLFFEINEELDVRRALTLQREWGIALILSGINQGEHLIGPLRESGASVVLSLNLPEENKQEFSGEEPPQDRKEQLEKINAAYLKRLEVAGEFEKAGVPFAFTTKHLDKDKFFDNIRLMIENGLSSDAALAALTINPAKILDIDNLAGEIIPGKMANILLTTDTLFSKDSQIKYVIANGYVFENPLKKADGKNGKEDMSYWEYETKTDAGAATGFFEINHKSGTPRGTITYEDPQGKGKITTSMDELKISENRMAFSFLVSTAKEDLTITIEGDLADDSLTGTMRIADYARFPFTAKKTTKPKQ